MKRLFLNTCLILCIAGYLYSQNTQTQRVLDDLYRTEGERYFSFFYDDPRLINLLTKDISIDKVSEGKVFAYANKKEFSKFLEYKLPYEMQPHPGDLLTDPKMLEKVNIRDIEEWNFYPTYDGYLDIMEQFQQQFPGLCMVYSIGQSVQGRELLVARISDNVGIHENEPQFLYTSSIHGDETTGYVLMLHLIDHLLQNYGTDDQVTEIVNNVDIYINPLANPDGTYAGGNNTVNGARRYNAYWVDLNRNYPDPENGPHPDGEEWQKETLMFMQFAEDNRFSVAANFHGGAEVYNYPWDTWSKLPADADWWDYVGWEYVDTVHANSPAGYMTLLGGVTPGYAWYEVDGGRQDYMNYFHQCREVTIEISDTKLLPASQLEAHWNYNYRSFLHFLEQSTYGIRGTVKDSISGWPIEAEVYVMGHEEDSSWTYSHLPNGNYHRLLYQGTYNVRFSAPGYQTKTVSFVTLTNRQPTVLNVKLLPDGGVGGIENNEIANQIKILENPVSSGFIRLRSEDIMMNIQIISLNGEKIMDVPLYDRKADLPVMSIPSGLYIIKVRTPEGFGSKKIILNTK